MKQINKAAIPLAAIALVATGALSTYALQSYAQTSTDSTITTNADAQSAKENPMSSLVKAIAEKFGLSQDDVQQVFDDNREQMQTQRKEAEAARLQQAVTDGKLTQEQADKITAKQTELEAQREANKDSFANKTEEERRTEMKAQMDELKQWATDNNIPEGYFPFGGPRGGHGGPGGFGGPRGDFQTTPAQ